MKDLYDILGVPKDADIDQIKKAYKRKAFDHHPDRNNGQASPEFQRITHAYNVLKDAGRRSDYDRYGFESETKSF